MATGGVQFEFDAWVAEQDIDRKISTALVKLDFNTYPALILLKQADIDSLEGTPGQKLILKKALFELGNLDFESFNVNKYQKPVVQNQKEDNQDNHDRDAEQGGNRGFIQALDAEMDGLAVAGTDKPPQVPLSSSLEFLKEKATRNGDLTILGYDGYDKKKVIMPYDVLSSVQKDRVDARRRDRFDKDSEGRARNKGVPYLTMAEYGMAAARIGLKLLKEGSVNVEGYVGYQAYVANIWHLAENHEWASVLNLDANYREAQAQFGFSWTERNPYMELHDLIKLDKSSKQKYGAKGSSSGGRGASGQTPFCRQFAAGHCNFGSRCKYQHVLPANLESSREAKNEGMSPVMGLTPNH